jgi:hypothetical protein
MSITLKTARKARTYYPLTDRVSRCRQAARYARALAILGDLWLLAKPVRQFYEKGA